MALIIEDGSIVTDANSFASLTQIKNYLALRGLDITTVDDAVLETYAVRATDFLNSLEYNYKGDRVQASQPLAWPRYNFNPYGVLWDGSIPIQLISAQSRLVYDLKNGIELFPVKSGQDIKREKVGPIETEYFGAATIAAELLVSEAFSILSPLFKSLRFTADRG